MEGPLKSKLLDLFRMDTMLDNMNLSSHVTSNGSLTFDHLQRYLKENLLFKHDNLAIENLVKVLKTMPIFKINEDDDFFHCETWSNIVYSIKVFNLSLHEFFELEEHFNNKDFDKDIKDKEFLSGESAMMINLNLNYETNAKADKLVGFIEKNPRFDTKKVQKNTSNLKDLLFKHYSESKLLEDVTALHIEPNRKMRLGSYSENHVTPSSIINFFLEHHYDVEINPNLLNVKTEAKPILNINGDIRVEELEPTVSQKGGEYHKHPNYYRYTLQVGRKGSFLKPERKGSHWNS